MTLKEISEIFNNLVKEGKGDYEVEFSTQDGSSYTITDKNDVDVWDAFETILVG